MHKHKKTQNCMYLTADSGQMLRVSRVNPCPVCGKPDWCLVASDGSAAICARIEDGSVKKCGEAGHLHILTDRHNGHNRHTLGARRRHLLKSGPRQEASQDFAELAMRYQRQLTGEKLHGLANALGVSPRSLQRLRGGWDGRAFTFPMSGDQGKIIGIRRRFPNGGKASTRGSKTGLFIPTDLGKDEPLLICEGPTDTAAALDLGFSAIGRPNCNSLAEMTTRVAKDRTKVVIVADNDDVGKAGAMKLANTLALHCPSVRVVQPPDGIKDLRQWLNRGLASVALQEIITAIAPIEVRVAFSREEVQQ